MKKGLKVFLVIFLAVLVLAAAAVGAGAWIWYNNPYTLELTMNGPQEITLEYGESYEEAGASAVIYGHWYDTERVSVEVERIGSVDDQTLGTYDIRYIARQNGRVGTAYRRVHVVDTQKPEITLQSNPDTYTLPGSSYQEEGFSAADNYDGDLTEKVQRTEVGGVVYYTVTDSAGNKTSAVRIIRYDDPIAPELTLEGEATMSLTVGNTYKEPGYTATDNCDGDLTQKVEISGEVNTSVSGTYTLTYTVKDGYGNTASATRTVKVKPRNAPSLPSTPSPVGGVIYLTFDDGPSAHTARLLDILDKYNVKATFFVVNTGYAHMISEIAARGHTVAIHTATHKYSQIYASDEAYFEDLYKMQDIIRQYSGQTSMLLRFPGGSSNTVSRSYNTGIMSRLTKEVEARGFKYFDWNVSSGDAGGAKDSDTVYYYTVSNIWGKRTAVVLQHDTKGYSVDAVERIIIWGLQNGYTFKALDANSPGCHHGVNN